MRSCLLFAVQADGSEIMTIEGLEKDGEFHPLQEAIRDCHSFQCGFCTPGFLMTAYAYLQEDHEFNELEIHEGAGGQPVPLHRLPIHCRRRGARRNTPRQTNGRGVVVRFVGESVPRVEDHRILTGRGKYVDDLVLPKMLHAAFVRSPFAHARIKRIDVDLARQTPGVVAVFTGDDMRRLCNPVSTSLAFGVKFPEFYPLTADKVRFVGDVVAMVVAESRYEAEDGCDLVEVEYDQLPVIANYDDAVDPTKPPLFDELGDNVVITNAPVSWGDVDTTFAEADRVVTATLRQHRVAPVPMRRGAVADYDTSSGDLTYASTQSPHGLRLQLANTLGHPMERFRVLANDVGGGFG